MKLVLTFFLLIPFTIFAQPTNDIKKLKETIHELAKEVMSDKKEFSLDFTLSLDEQKIVSKAFDKTISEIEVLKEFKTYQKYTSEKYTDLKESSFILSEFISFDTITYKSRGMPYLDILLLFKGTRDKYSNRAGNSDTIRIATKFVIINNKIKIDGSIYSTSIFYHDLDQLNLVKNTHTEFVVRKYKNYYETSEDGVIPIRNKNKWGLVSLNNNKMLLPAIYDSIFPFYDGFARVVINGGHNLIGRNLKPVFSENKVRIKLIDGIYLIADKNGKYQSLLDLGINSETAYIPLPEKITNSGEKQDLNINKPLRERLAHEYYKSAPYKMVQTQRYGQSFCYVINKINGDTLSSFHGFEFIDSHGDYLFGRRNDSSFVMKPDGKILFKNNNVCKIESPGYVIVYDKGKRLFGIYCPYTNIYIKPIYYYIEPIDRDRFFVVITKKGKIGYLNTSGKELFDTL